MKVFMVMLGVLLVGILGFVFLAWQSQRAPDLGLRDGMLQACPPSPNCVCSEPTMASDAAHAVRPWSADVGQWQRLPALIQQHGGVVEQQAPNYIHASFSSAVFHFVDDVEFRWDAAAKKIFVRSASRVGRSDLGVNRQRVEDLHAALKKLDD